MFYIKKVVTPFIVPPGLFILLLILSGVWFIRRRSLRAGLLQLSVGLGMWVAALGPVSDLFLHGLTPEPAALSDIRGDVIILLGGGINDSVQDLSGWGVPSPEMIERIVAAVRLHKRLGAPILSTGGGYAHQAVTEAEVTRRYLMDLGVPAERIFLEKNSRDTIENARFTQDLCRKLGFRRPILVTSGYHLRRAMWSFRKVGLTVTPFPAGGGARPPAPWTWVDFLPTDYASIGKALKEHIGLAAYRVLY